MDEKKPLPDPLRGIRDYNDELTISQVIRYFGRQGVFFTKPMIQNYVRAGLLPLPREKRYYTRVHMVLLALIESLKKGFSQEEIRRLFGALGERPGEPGEMLALYAEYLGLANRLAEALDGILREMAAGSGGSDNTGTAGSGRDNIGTAGLSGGDNSVTAGSGGSDNTGTAGLSGRAEFLAAAACMAGSVILREAAGKLLK